MKFCWKSTIFGSLFHSLSSAFLIGLARSFLQLRFNIWYNDISLMKKKNYLSIYRLSIRDTEEVPHNGIWTRRGRKKNSFACVGSKGHYFHFQQWKKHYGRMHHLKYVFQTQSNSQCIFWSFIFIFIDYNPDSRFQISEPSLTKIRVQITRRVNYWKASGSKFCSIRMMRRFQT